MRAHPSGVVWQDVECGGYAADLDLWEELAGAADGAVLDLGCGTGRVALRLAERGRDVTGLDLDPELVEAFNRRAGGLPARAHPGDASGFSLDGRFGLAIAPMQLVQLLADEERAGLLRCAARHLRPGGTLALAIVEEPPAPPGGAGRPLPDVREIDGWIYSSLPLDAFLDGAAIVVRRLRQTVGPDGELGEETSAVELRTLSAGTLEREAATAGLRAAGRREIPASEDHVGSTAVLLEKGA